MFGFLSDIEIKIDNIMKKISLLLIASSLCLLTFGQAKNTSSIDSLMANFIKPSEPGYAIGVVKDGELIYNKGFGLADLEHQVEITPESKFYIASNSKQFTAFCALLLEEQGLLDLDQTVQTYLPDFPEYQWPITVRQLIHHTNGFRDSLHLLFLKGKDLMNEITDKEVYDLIKSQKSLNHQPGEKFLYNNTGYFLLGMIIEKVSGQSLKDFAHQHIFEPLGMTNTFYYDDNTVLVKNRVQCYEKSGSDFKNLPNRFQLVGSGGVYSTIEDLALWDQNFYNNKLGKGGQVIIAKMYQEGLLNNGNPCGYAFGLNKNTYKGLDVVHHGGALAGYRSEFLRIPEQQLSVIILANRGDTSLRNKAYAIADFFLDIDKAPKETPNKNVPEVEDKFRLEQLIGHYELRPGMLVEITTNNDVLQLHQKWNYKSYPIVNRSGNVYEVPNEDTIVFEFSVLENGTAQKLIAVQSDKRTVANRIEVSSQPTDLKQYIGSYFNNELEITYLVSLDNDDLSIEIPYSETFRLKYITDDTFITANGAKLTFEREKDSIRELSIDTGRVNDLSFIKQ